MADEEKKAQDESVNITGNINPEWADRKKWELETRIAIRQESEQVLEIWKTKELKVLEDKQNEIIKENLEKLVAKYKEEQKPPTPAEIAELLNQEYETFPLKLQVEDGTGEYKDHSFTIRELPQAVEIKFYNQFQGKILGKAQDLQAFTQESIDMPFEQKVKSILEVFGQSFDMLAETVVLVLNPFGKKAISDKIIDREWVQSNISSNRQWNIIEAQLKVNRVKDFFLRISASGQQTQTMITGLNFQQLQRLAR